MKILIAGGTGFLGRPLAAALAAEGHDVAVRGRSGVAASDIDGASAVVNLAGESIAGRRWTAAQKQRILDSRVQATRSLVTAIQGAAAPPPVFISGSAVGYYGPLGDAAVTEEAPAGSDFLAQVCVQWEREALLAASDRTRVVCVRTGLVLEKDGGALPQMLPPFKFGAGGPVGSGRQYWPWIHRDDWIALARWAIKTPAVSGPINATAPTPVTNADFARALGRAMHRPAFMPAPGFALRLLLGEMADGLLLSGQRAVPAKATRLGFQFKYVNLKDALQAIFS
ncbi:MAG: TIGR01777 family protein [Acidobacteria bacterium]|nr:TIGR01777 family protein [Acidobacteriota bacterium]